MTTTNKKLTLADLVAAKLERERRWAKKDYYVKALGGEITIELPEEKVMVKALDMIKENTLANILECYAYVIYHSVSLLRNTELHKECEVQDPIDIVGALLDAKDRVKLGELILKMAGMEDKSRDIKN